MKNECNFYFIGFFLHVFHTKYVVAKMKQILKTPFPNIFESFTMQLGNDHWNFRGLCNFFSPLAPWKPPLPLRIKAKWWYHPKDVRKYCLCLNLMYDHHHIIYKQMVDKIHTILYFPVGYTACYCLKSNAISIFFKKKLHLNLPLCIQCRSIWCPVEYWLSLIIL